MSHQCSGTDIPAYDQLDFRINPSASTHSLPLFLSLGNFLNHLEWVDKVSMLFRAPQTMWAQLPTIDYLDLQTEVINCE